MLLAPINVAVAGSIVVPPRTVSIVFSPVTHDTGMIYELITVGTSAGSGGPTGTGVTIADGSCLWTYVGVKATFSTLLVTT